MTFQQLLNKDSGLSARAKLNSMLSALIQSDEGVNAVWVFLRSLEQAMRTLSSKENNDVADLRDSLSGANDYTDKAVNKLYTYVDAMNGGVGGLIDSTSYDPAGLPTDKPCTLIALGEGTFTNLKDVTGTAITVSQSNSITVFFRAAHITYWNYKTEVLTVPPMDDTPTNGNTTHVVSSDGVYDFVLEKTLEAVDVANLDTFKDGYLRKSDNTQKYLLSYNGRNCGTLQVISDSNGHVVTQVITTHYLYDDSNGTINWNGHSDNNVVQLYRSIKISGGTLPDDNWTRWNYVNNEILSLLKDADTALSQRITSLEEAPVQLRVDTRANWVTTNPVLALGEPGCESDTRRWKIGDGVTEWNSLPYFGADPIVLFSELDNFKDSNLRDNSTPSRYVVVDSVAKKSKVGTLDIISDNMNHVVTQVFTTHQSYDDSTGTISSGAHDDKKVVCVYRSIKISGGTLPDDNWTRWNYVNNEILSAIKDELAYMLFKDGVFDVSHYKAVGSTLTRYETLALALDAVPEEYQRGGMSVKYVDTTGKYVQYRLMATAWSIDVADWKNYDVGNVIENAEMDDVLGGDVAVYLTDINGKAVLDDYGKPIEII